MDDKKMNGAEITYQVIKQALIDAHKKGMCDMSRGMLESGAIGFVQHQRNLQMIANLDLT
jgi:hypothetical protein